MKNAEHIDHEIAGRERRRFTRVDFEHTVKWSHFSGDRGVTSLHNISRGGLCLSLDRFFRPGPVVEFTFEDILLDGEPVKFEALIVWCHATRENPECFDVGFRIVHDTPEKLSAVSEVVYCALEEKISSECAGEAPLRQGCPAV